MCIVWKRETPILESSGNITSIKKEIARAVATALSAVADPDGGFGGFNPSFLVGVAPFLSKWY